jgi:hypothetical protein
MNHVTSSDISAVIESCDNSVDLLSALKSLMGAECDNPNVSSLIHETEVYFEETGSKILQILRSHTGTFEFEVCHPHKAGEDVNILLELGCEFYMLVKC